MSARDGDAHYGDWLVCAWECDWEGQPEVLLARSHECGSRDTAILRFAEHTGYQLPPEGAEGPSHRVEAYPLDFRCYHAIAPLALVPWPPKVHFEEATA